MTFEKIKKKLKRSRVFEKYIYSIVGVSLIFLFIFIFITKGINIAGLTLGLLSISVGIYVVYLALKTDKFTIIENELTQTENAAILKEAILEFSNALMSNNYAFYTHYQKNIWKTPYEIYLYAGNNFIALNVRLDYKGIIDFGRSDTQRKKIIELFEKYKFQIKYKETYNHNKRIIRNNLCN